MVKSVENYVERYIKRYHHKIKQVCEPLKQAFGINYFTYHSLTSDGYWRPLVSRPDWADHYTHQELYLLDPLMLQPSCYQTGALFWTHYVQKEEQITALKYAKENFDMSHGFCLIERQKERCEFFGFNAPASHEKIYSTYLNDQALLKKFCQFFKEELLPILNMAEADPIDLFQLKGTAFRAEDSPFEQPSPAKDLFLNFIRAKPSIQLSRREKECLNHYSDEMRMQDVAEKLGLSVRTVESYLNHIKNKLNCANKKELIAKGHELRSLGLLQ
ncbi:helix-turn-helix transcriptional regulator [Candidatus Protochlamydia phocaeensis]|uniref:helix-turn-helix transcriptional regulator n=1 Tax=Candidatus Protochlamydia phocaeensis TaxID=1414722 RepID=UPI000ADE6594|nr:LuxR C-terminal-related transcriptional regulator [Candidatus Protochlamydia phocaeensis]